ncbi:MAG TPA: phosphotransferase family protein [Gemmataceae bacterium]|nr:phosphotransferase family protein [Gemmataceae bacterium]
MDTYTDETQPVRPGEELNLALLEPYLRKQFPQMEGPLVVKQFPHGHSNLTYLLRWGNGEMVLRRPPFGNQVKSAHDMSREFRVLAKLWNVFPPAPRPYLFCEDESILGGPFYVMERRRGTIFRRTSPGDARLTPEAARKLSLTLIDNLAQLHSLDYQAAGLGDLGKPEGYISRQVSGWIERYRKSQTDNVPAMETISSYLTTNMPSEPGGTALIHNDFKYDNLLFDPADWTKIVAVFDWEMATIGDPLMDLGSTLGYWVEPTDSDAMKAFAFGPTIVPGSMTRQELAERYAKKTGKDISHMLFYYCYGMYKIAVIIQQIYVRYFRGYTKDERFSRLNERVADTAQATVQALATGKY